VGENTEGRGSQPEGDVERGRKKAGGKKLERGFYPRQGRFLIRNNREGGTVRHETKQIIKTEGLETRRQIRARGGSRKKKKQDLPALATQRRAQDGKSSLTAEKRTNDGNKKTTGKDGIYGGGEKTGRSDGLVLNLKERH